MWLQLVSRAMDQIEQGADEAAPWVALDVDGFSSLWKLAKSGKVTRVAGELMLRSLQVFLLSTACNGLTLPMPRNPRFSVVFLEYIWPINPALLQAQYQQDRCPESRQALLAWLMRTGPNGCSLAEHAIRSDASYLLPLLAGLPTSPALQGNLAATPMHAYHLVKLACQV